MSSTVSIVALIRRFSTQTVLGRVSAYSGISSTCILRSSVWLESTSSTDDIKRAAVTAATLSVSCFTCGDAGRQMRRAGEDSIANECAVGSDMGRNSGDE